MKLSTLSIIITTAIMPIYASAASMDDLRLSGFGSVGVGISNNDAGFAGYEDKIDFKQDTLIGLQFDFNINDKAKVTTQLVADGRYDFEPTIEVAYLSYDLDTFTVRGGKMRTQLYMYSDYLDVGYAYPMIRPPLEIYENIIISNYTGFDLLIPFTIGETTLQLQPFAGVTQVEERHSSFGSEGDATYGIKIEIEDLIGMTAHWYVADWTFRAAYSQGEVAETGVAQMDFYVANKTSQFSSAGMQYNNGQLLFNAEAMSMTLDGPYPDHRGLSALLGYQLDSFMPYVSISNTQTTDDEDRIGAGVKQSSERMTYSIGNRWDFAKNMALKVDVTYSDFKDTYGGLGSNIDYQIIDGNLLPVGTLLDDTIVYSMSIDFVY
ncbi:hypothetical protein [Shewanella youngdeokensis]|uniref:Porin domain-containing protein n=1 Tax=Shewanella youngdeokensis TaxID=2999068 RepID=A0ABZ0JY83_9GAMM|nr:hypothetical protein RGE70_14705 [Shewanella sp. DAU334]